MPVLVNEAVPPTAPPSVMLPAAFVVLIVVALVNVTAPAKLAAFVLLLINAPLPPTPVPAMERVSLVVTVCPLRSSVLPLTLVVPPLVAPKAPALPKRSVAPLFTAVPPA